MVVQRTSMLTLIRVMKIIFNKKQSFRKSSDSLKLCFYICSHFTQLLLSEDYQRNH